MLQVGRFGLAPKIILQISGSQVDGVKTWSRWNSSISGNGISGGFPLPSKESYPGTLSTQAGQSIEIVVAYSDPPAVLWVIELDSSGVPMASSALTHTTSSTPYVLANSGQYVLQVTAQWAYGNIGTYVFDLNIQP
jgi:hypothetical protein